ncbi:MAG TPA: hypothetical protein VH087_17465 [Thermoanaerobaculia bacterium]|jgi:hypothetical protein|nr:hypothetical protein [Thermoanaerobaculia bacterium]
MNTTKAVLVLGCLMVAASAKAADSYPTMADIGQYTMVRASEIALAKSAAPPSVAEHAKVMVLGEHGYETAVEGTNGFVCFVGRSWDVSFDNPEFWNPKMRSPQCFNAAAVRSVLPRYLERTKWVLEGLPKAEMGAREAAAWKAGTLTEPEAGAVSLMFSKGGYLNDSAAGPWHPHYMLFVPRTDASQWGADLPGSPVASDSVSYERTTIIMVKVPNWSDGTPAPQGHEHH